MRNSTQQISLYKNFTEHPLNLSDFIHFHIFIVDYFPLGYFVGHKHACPDPEEWGGGGGGQEV